MSSKFWKDAATLMLVARTNMKTPASKFNYKLCFGQRSSHSGFMADAYVFPGGVYEEMDLSQRWLSVFHSVGFSKPHLQKLSEIHGPRPPLFIDHKSSTLLPPEIGFRITALREMYEEAGILLLHDGQKRVANLVHASEWRRKVHKDPSAFIDLCLETQTCPDVWSLYEWSNWLTPNNFSSRRYDTVFYVSFLDSKLETDHDEKEVAKLEWLTPPEILARYANRELWLAPPQVYELSRLLKISNFDDLQKFATDRQYSGLERWLPVRVNMADGLATLYPGDSDYPEHPVYETSEEMLESDLKLADHRQKAASLNRMEFYDPYNTQLHVDIPSTCDHLVPTHYNASKL